MFISDESSPIHTIKPGDRDWLIQGKLTMTGRASIQIDQRCPDYYAKIILDAYNRGWVKPVAHVTEKEKVLIGLSRA